MGGEVWVLGRERPYLLVRLEGGRLALCGSPSSAKAPKAPQKASLP